MTGNTENDGQLYLFAFEFDYVFVSMLFFSASHTLSPSLYSARGLFLYSKWENKWIIISRPPERPISFTVHFVRNILWGLKHFSSFFRLVLFCCFYFSFSSLVPYSHSYPNPVLSLCVCVFAGKYCATNSQRHSTTIRIWLHSDK